MPGMVEQDVAGWEQFFRRYTRLTARYALEGITVRGDEAHATVRTLYTYVPAPGGAQSESQSRQTIRFLKTPDGWRGADIRHAPSPAAATAEPSRPPRSPLPRLPP